jgi:benzoyl-CoA reductase/2-hydroxyglutaryl-CoA dehydratase subunit BcrC/BadD/HgdB
MDVQQRIKQILTHKPSPKKISRGALFGMMQKACTPVSHFHGRAHKKLSVLGFNHAWKFFGSRERSVFTSLFSPIEIVYAHNLLPFMLEALSGVAAKFDLAGDFLSQMERKWYTTDFCSVHRIFISVAQHHLLPIPRFLLSTSNACDGNLKSFGEVGTFYEKPHLFISVPYYKDEDSLNYLARQLEACSRHIEEITGKKLKRRNLERSFYYANRASVALREINRLRTDQRALMYGDEGLGLLLLWGLFMGSRQGAAAAESYRDELARRAASTNETIRLKKRLLWLNLKPYYDNHILHMLEKELNAVVVAEEINLQPWPELDTSDPWKSLARKMVSQAWIGKGEYRIQNIRRAIEEYAIDGVVHYSHWGCRQSNGAVRLIRDAVQEYGIPFLEIDGDLVDPRNYAEGQIRTRIEGFVEVMEGV